MVSLPTLSMVNPKLRGGCMPLIRQPRANDPNCRQLVAGMSPPAAFAAKLGRGYSTERIRTYVAKSVEVDRSPRIPVIPVALYGTPRLGRYRHACVLGSVQ